MTRFKQISTVFIAFAVACSVLVGPIGVGVVAAQSSVTVTQTAQGATTVNPGDSITVDVTIETEESGSPAIELNGVPAGWTINAIDNDGGDYNPNNYEWFWLGDSDLNGNYTHTVTYEVTVPTDASDGTFQIEAVGSSQGDEGVDDDYEDSETLSITVQSQQQNQPPTASFTASPTNPETGQTVTFDASGSSDDGSIDSYEWDFDGDGTVDQTTSSSSITHSFGSAGSYDVELTVEDNDGASDSTINTVDVSQAQGSSVSVSQTSQGSTTVNPGNSITVDVSIDTTNSGSPAIELNGVPAGWTIDAIDNDGGDYNPNNYEWFWLQDSDLNGDYSHTVTYEVTVPTDASDGTFQIEAVGSSQGDEGVDDDYQDTDTLSITVQSQQQNQPPTASFTASPTNPETGQTVTFDASGSSDDGSIDSYEWDFDGDGTVDQTTNSPTVTHSYGAAGSYDVELTVTDDENESDSTINTVDVSQAQGSSVSVEQTAQDSTTVAPGDSITVDVSIETTNSGAPAIELDGVPAGWDIDAIDNDSGSYSSANKEWFWSGDSDLNGDYSHTITYQVTVPSDASDGSYAIDAVGSSQGDEGVDDDYEDTDTLSITVQGQPEPPSATLTITPNSGIEASAYNTGSFTIENTGGQNIESVTIDLSSTTFPDVVFDPEGTAGDMGAKGLDIDSQSGDGVGVVSTADANVFSQPHNGVNGSDGYDVMTIEFTDFEPGETLVFSVDNDPTSIKGATIGSQEAGPISGLEMARATVTVDYTNAVQTTQTFGDGSAGGSEAIADADIPASPTITVENVNLDQNALDAQHNAATVSNADQNIIVTGPPGATVTLVRVEGELALQNVPDYNGTPGYEIEEFEANNAEDVEYYSATLDSNGEATIPVTLTNTNTDGDNNAGLNYFVAAVVDGDGPGLASNVTVLEYEPNEPPTASFTVSPSTPEAGQTVTFTADASDPDGSIESYQWMIETAGGQTTTLLESDFEVGSLSAADWTHVPDSPDAGAGVSNATANSGTQSVFHNGGAGALVSPAVDASGAQSVTISYWIRKGDESFSENPDADQPEDMIVEYFSADGNWIEIGRVESSVADGAIFAESMTISSTDVLHNDLQLRFRQEGGSAANGDFWHVDDVEITAESVTMKTGETVTNTFGTPGTYNVSLTVTDNEGASDTTMKSVTVSGLSNESLTFNDQPLGTDGTVTVENVSTNQPSTVVVTYTNESGSVIVAGLVSADNLNGEDVSVTIQDAGGFPGEHTAWVFADDDLAGLNLAAGDDVLATTGLSASEVQDLALDVESAEVTLQPIGIFENPPTDPDNDGKYEDVNGDGSANVGDVQALFANKNDPVIKNNVAAFDFNGDGKVNVGDVQALFAIEI